MRIAGAVVLTVWALQLALMDPPTAAAAPCPDVEVVFARGTSEPPGVGRTGQAFVDALRPQVGARSVGVYAVNYPGHPRFRPQHIRRSLRCERPPPVDGRTPEPTVRGPILV